MIRIIVILIITVIILPVMAFRFDEPLSPQQHDMLMTSVYIMLGVALSCFALSELTGNCSQVNKIWSIVPMVYTWYFAYASEWNTRLVLMAVLTTIWGVRLTYNFSRRGAYKLKFWEGEEDYRWEVLRRKPELKGRLRWTLFNLFFISLYQNALILFFTLPSLMAFQGQGNPLGTWDYALAAIMIILVILETVADQQQWRFQNEKHRKKKSGETMNDEETGGFVRSGLWKWVRHPNYAAEQAIWITFYLFSVAATGRWVNWSMAGSLLLLILFQGSSDFSEAISAEKYPGYKDYQKKVGRFLPRLF